MSNATTETFSNRLKKLRMEKGFSQRTFTKKVDLNYSQYNRYERGDSIPTTETISKLATALGVSVDFLLEGKTQDAATANFEDKDLLRLFERLEKLPPEDKNSIKDVIDGFLMKKELRKQLVG